MLTRTELEMMRDIFERETGMSDLKRKYEEYKKFDTPRNFEKMKKECVLDDYLKFMNDCENFFENDAVTIETVSMLAENRIEGRIELPKPSNALEAFKNKFNKFLGGKNE